MVELFFNKKSLRMSDFSKNLNIDQAFKYNGFIHGPLDNPYEIGCFSVDANHKMRYDRSQMKYYVPRIERNVSLDLNVGYGDPIQISGELPDEMDLRNGLYEWIRANHFEPLHRWDVDFVCNRGSLQRLLCTPYCSGEFDYWTICACRLDDVIYFEEFERDDKIEREEGATDFERRMWSWGYKFEQYMTADKPDGVPEVLSNTKRLEQFWILFMNRMGSFNLMMSAEVDGVSPSRQAQPGSGNTSCYVEMKTSKIKKNFGRSFLFKKYKSVKLWAQSVIIGIEKNIFGLRDDDGIVRSIQEFRTSDLPHMCQDMWNPEVCFNFCNNFLKYLYNKLDQNNPRIVYKFDYSGGSKVSVTRLQRPEVRYRLLPDWYILSCRRERNMYRR